MPPYNILFLCTGNSARSILSEVLATQLSHGKFIGHSAGSQPMGRVNPLAIETLEGMGFDTAGLRSKSWEEFAGPDAPQMDFIITVCDNAAGESCPVWPGKPITAHWGFADPSHVEDEAARREAFKKTAIEISERLHLLLALPVETLDHMTVVEKLREMGRM